MRRDPQLFAIRPDALLSRPVHKATIPSTPDPTPSPREHPAEIRKPEAGTRGGHAPHPTMPRPGGRLSRAVGPVATRRCSVVRAVRRLTNGCPDAGSASRHVPTAPTESRRSTSPPVTPSAGSAPRGRPTCLTRPRTRQGVPRKNHRRSAMLHRAFNVAGGRWNRHGAPAPRRLPEASTGRPSWRGSRPVPNAPRATSSTLFPIIAGVPPPESPGAAPRRAIHCRPTEIPANGRAFPAPAKARCRSPAGSLRQTAIERVPIPSF